MTVLAMTTIKRWLGLSTDTKPVRATADVPTGSTFWEYDTKILYITYDGTNWVPYAYTINTVNVAVSRDMPFLSEFWDTESLSAGIWETTIDGAGTEAFGTSGGYMYYDIDTDAVADNDVILNSKYRWICIPSVFGDSNSTLQRLVLEWEAQAVTAITSHDNTHFFMGLNSVKTNDITQQNLIGFYLDTDVLKGKADKAGTEGTTGAIAGTLTDWNKFKITVDAASIKFTFNGADETPLIVANQQPDVAMYLVFGTRAEAGAAVGLNIGSIRTYYEEVL